MLKIVILAVVFYLPLVYAAVVKDRSVEVLKRQERRDYRYAAGSLVFAGWSMHTTASGIDQVVNSCRTSGPHSEPGQCTEDIIKVVIGTGIGTTIANPPGQAVVGGVFEKLAQLYRLDGDKGQGPSETRIQQHSTCNISGAFCDGFNAAANEQPIPALVLLKRNCPASPIGTSPLGRYSFDGSHGVKVECKNACQFLTWNMGDMNEGLNAVATLIIAAGGDQSEFTIEDVSSKGALLRCRVNFLSQPPDLSCPDQIDGNGCRADL